MPAQSSSGPRLCEKSARHKCTPNFVVTRRAKNAEIRAPHGITTKSDRVFTQVRRETGKE
jgi:hypothetical protein